MFNSGTSIKVGLHDYLLYKNTVKYFAIENLCP